MALSHGAMVGMLCVILVFLDRTHLFFEMIKLFMLNLTEHGIHHPYKC